MAGFHRPSRLHTGSCPTVVALGSVKHEMGVEGGQQFGQSAQGHPQSGWRRNIGRTDSAGCIAQSPEIDPRQASSPRPGCGEPRTCPHR